MDTTCDLKECRNIKDGACDSEDRYKNCIYGWSMDFMKKNGYRNQLDKESIKDVFNNVSI